MKKVIALSFIVSGLLLGCGGDDNAKFKQALYFTEKGAYTDALKLYSSIIKDSPKNFGAYTNRGMVFETIASKDLKNRRRLLANAERDYVKAVEINSSNPQALNNLGAFYLDQGRYYNAIIFLNEAIKLNPQYYTAIVNRGIAYYNVGEGIKAYNDFYRAIQIDDQNWAAFFNRGLYYYDTGDFLNAALDFTRTIQLRPNFARAYLERGRALKMNQMYADAFNDFQTAVQMDPNNALAHYYMGEMYFKHGDYEEALSELLKSKELDQSFVPVYELMGDIFAASDTVAAAANYVIARTIDPANADRYNAKIQMLKTDAGQQALAGSRFF
ncbi:MAG: tetratricopeptide repeat protein [Elusimicrobia bacterium]|nr:tetratricopeptide repeat protein [Elusimicrobiota bacterium]